MTLNNVFSILKQYKERTEQLLYLNRKYETELSKLELTYQKNNKTNTSV